MCWFEKNVKSFHFLWGLKITLWRCVRILQETNIYYKMSSFSVIFNFKREKIVILN